MSAERRDLVFLVDVDNTLIDNDRVKRDIATAVARAVGPELADTFWRIYEDVRRECGVVDFPETLRRFRMRDRGDARTSRVDRVVLAMPFARYLFPGARQVLERLSSLGEVAILSDGDRVYQPAKIARAGLLLAVRGNVFVYDHKEDHLAEVERRLPATHYCHVDDKRELLAHTKERLRDRVTTVHVRQGHYAADPSEGPPPDISVDRIADLRRVAASSFAATARTPLARLTTGGGPMPQQAWSNKRERQYEHIKDNLEKRGRSEDTAERIAAATVNQTRTAKGETKERKLPAERARAKRDMAAAGRKGAKARARRS
jgi:FMN phosphatase YigB (HAD superfamily)